MGPEARARYDAGLALYQAKDYDGAIRAFAAGYALEPRREFLFSEAQARRLSGDCRGAVALYQKFLATAPPAVQVNATQIALARCAQQLAQSAAAPVVVAPPPPRAPPPVPAPWHHDRAGAALLGAGVLALGVGGAFLAASFAARADADGAVTYDDYARHRATAASRWDVALVGLVGGGLLTAAGVGRYLVVRRRARAEIAVSAAPGLLLVQGRF